MIGATNARALVVFYSTSPICRSLDPTAEAEKICAQFGEDPAFLTQEFVEVSAVLLLRTLRDAESLQTTFKDFVHVRNALKGIAKDENAEKKQKLAVDKEAENVLLSIFCFLRYRHQ